MENTEKLYQEYLSELAFVLAHTDDQGLIEDFLHSLLTEAEVLEFGARWGLVRMIEDGISQRQISRDLGLSLCKITRGAKELKKENSPFRRMIESLKELRGSRELPVSPLLPG